MVNGLHLYSAFIHTHIHGDWLPCKAPAHQEQLRVRCLAQGHFEPATLRLPDDSSYLLSHIAPIEIQKEMLNIITKMLNIITLNTDNKKCICNVAK